MRKKLYFVAMIISFIAVFIGWGCLNIAKSTLSIPSFVAVSPIAVEFGTEAYFTSTTNTDPHLYDPLLATPGNHLPETTPNVLLQGSSKAISSMIASSDPSVLPSSLPSTFPTSVPSHQEITIPVLNYHSIAIDPGNITAISPSKFSEQMKYLSEHSFHPLTLAEFISILEKQTKAPAHPILLTFDDGYADNYTNVFPILLKYKFPATLFISPGVIDQQHYLSWEQVKEMHKNGWDIEPHGMTHPHLPQLTREKQTFEILEAKKQIEEQLGTIADVFCYPYGEYNTFTLDILRQNQFRYAFTIQQGLTASTQPPLKLKRIFVNGEVPLNVWIRTLSSP